MSLTEAYNRYYELRRQGVPELQASQQSGYQQIIQNIQANRHRQAQEQQKAAASREAKAQRAGLGGQIVGLAGAKGLYNYVTDKPILGEKGDKLYESLFGSGSDAEIGAVDKLLRDQVPSESVQQAQAAFDATTTTPTATTTPTDAPTTTTDVPTTTDTGGFEFGVGDALQGALGAYNVYQGVQKFKSGDKLEGALGAYTGAGQLASSMGQSIPGAGPVGAIYGAYQLGKLALNDDITKSQTGSATAQGAAAGAAVGSAIPGVGTAIGAIVGGTIGFIKGISGSGKGERQIIRDKWRKAMNESEVGLWDPETWKGTLPDGTVFDWGKDRFGFGTDEKSGDINLKENAVHGQAASYGNLMSTLMGIGEGKTGESIAAQYALASLADNEGSTANATDDQVKERFRYFMQKNEFDLPAAQQHISNMLAEGKINQEYHDIQQNNLNMLMEQEIAAQGVQ